MPTDNRGDNRGENRGEDREPAGAKAVPDTLSIVVLPFENTSGDPEQSYFSDGLAEDILGELSKISGLFVIARDSAFSYRENAAEPHHIASELGVRFVLQGAVRKAGARVLIDARVLDALKTTQIWAEQYDHNLPDLYEVEHKILDSVVAAIEAAHGSAKLHSDKNARRVGRALRPAKDFVVRAVARIWRLSEADVIQGQKLLEQAIQVDPEYAYAHSVLAFSRVFSVHSGWSDSHKTLPLALQSAQTALSHDAHDPMAFAAMAYGLMIAHRSADALAAARRALELNPNFALGYYILSLVLAAEGKGREAIVAAERAIRISPRDPFKGFFSAAAGFANFAAGRYAEATEWARLADSESPGSAVVHRLLVASAAQAGLLDEARTALAELKRMHPDVSLALVESSGALSDADLRARYIDGLRKAGLV
jgi:TolB-like protein